MQESCIDRMRAAQILICSLGRITASMCISCNMRAVTVCSNPDLLLAGESEFVANNAGWKGLHRYRRRTVVRANICSVARVDGGECMFHY